MRHALVAVAVVIAARPALADHLAVTVTEVAGGVAYIDKGSRDGVVRGTRITFGATVLVVVEVTQTTAVIETAALAVGARGTAVVTPGGATVSALPKPRAPEAFRAQWPDPVVPATAQAPKQVPLGGAGPRGRARLAVIGHGFATADRDHLDASGEARIAGTFDAIGGSPFGIDFDIAGRAFRAGANGAERTPVLVRTAQVRYGDALAPMFAVGRLRYAASSVGGLDGGRAAFRTGRIELAAFGGLVPDPVSGKPAGDAARFGVEATLDAPDLRWRPRLSLTAYGSTWDGRADERRVVVGGSVNRDAWWLDGWAEGQAFAADNPWNARSVELVGAGTTASWRTRGMRVAADITFLRPERSLRLAAALPAEWLCTRRDDGTCEHDAWTSGSLSAGLDRGRWSLDAIGAIGRTNGVAIAYDASGYLGGTVRFGPRRVFASLAAGQASFARWTSMQLGAGVALSRRLDVATSYRAELLDYVAATGAVLQHAATLDLHVALGRDLDLAMSAVGTSGDDRDVLALLSTIIWRPLP